MRIVVFDTETTSITKPFIYNIGYTIYDTDEDKKLVEKDFIVEQIWHNRELFTTAYFSSKRDGYIARMKARTCRMEKLGYITQEMKRDFKFYKVEGAFAHNSNFDDGAFTFVSEWFKIINPFDDIPIYDIIGYAQNFITCTSEYQEFCEKNKFFTEGGNYPFNAEILYRFISKDTEFIEAHTALADTQIELDILKECISKGAEWCKTYKKEGTIPRFIDKVLEVRGVDGSITTLPYQTITVYKEKDNKKKVILKNRKESKGE